MKVGLLPAVDGTRHAIVKTLRVVVRFDPRFARWFDPKAAILVVWI